MMRSAERIAGLQFLETHNGADVASQNLGHILALVGMHLHQAADAVRLAGARIEDRVAGLERAGVDANEGQLAEGIVDNLEDQSREWLIVFRLAHLDRAEMVGIDTFDRRLVQRGGEGIDSRVPATSK